MAKQMNSPIIAVKNISKSYNKKVILLDLNLDVYKGEFVVVLGKTGSGKSVLLRMILGLEKPDTGKIRIDQQNYWDLHAKNRLEIGKRFGVVYDFSNSICCILILKTFLNNSFSISLSIEFHAITNTLPELIFCH